MGWIEIDGHVVHTSSIGKPKPLIIDPYSYEEQLKKEAQKAMLKHHQSPRSMTPEELEYYRKHKTLEGYKK